MIIGKVYILTSQLTEKCYIGSTTYQYLSQRFNTHRIDYKEGTKDYQGLFGYDKEGNYIEPDISLIDEVQADTKEELKEILTKCEQEWIDLYEDLCINKKRAYVTPEQRKEMMSKSCERYQQSPAGKISLRKASLRQNIKKLQPEVDTLKKEIEEEKEQQDLDMGGYLTLSFEGIDSDYSKIYCDILDRQEKTSRKAKKYQKRLVSLNKFTKELSELSCDT